MTNKELRNTILGNIDIFTTLSDLDDFMCNTFGCESAYEGFFEQAVKNSSYVYKIELDDEEVEIDMQYEIVEETDDDFENYYIKFTDYSLI